MDLGSQKVYPHTFTSSEPANPAKSLDPTFWHIPKSIHPDGCFLVPSWIRSFVCGLGLGILWLSFGFGVQGLGSGIS